MLYKYNLRYILGVTTYLNWKLNCLVIVDFVFYLSIKNPGHQCI